MRFAARLACVLGAWLACAGAPAFAADAADITPAERLIFTTEHLHGVDAQTELDYAMIAKGQDAASDVVRVLVTSPGNANGDAQVSDRQGPVALPDDGLRCNPVIIYFLERDIAEMEQLTGGQRRYFQQRLRLALAAGPHVTDVTSRIGDKPVRARQVVVQPYLNDPNAERFAAYIAKRYTFVLADSVPGQVAMIRTDVPGEGNDFAHPLRTETLSFQGALRSLPAKPGLNGPKPPDAPRASGPNAVIR